MRQTALTCPVLLGRVLLCGAAVVTAAASADLTYTDVPRVTVQDPAVFRTVLEDARTGVVRIAVFGDSQETAPWGWGEHYLAHLNARFAQVYGPAGESQLFTNHTAIARPMWLATMQESTNTAPTRVIPAALLPGVTAQSLLYGGKTWGSAASFVFLHDASFCSDPSLAGGAWFDPAGPYRAEILTVTHENGPGIRWRNAPTNGDVPNAAARGVQAGILAANTTAPAGTFAWVTTPTLSRGTKAHLQLMLQGDSAKVGSDVIGVRFASTAARRGVVMQSFARGGMKLSDLVAEHGESGAMLRAIDPSVVVLHYGANDSGNLLNLEQWRAQLVGTIDWLRTELENPALRVIIASDLRHGSGGNPQWFIERMPVIAHEVALADPYVLALNVPRIVLDEYGWGGSMRYMADTAHYRPYAQRKLAEAFVGELTRALSIADPACASANWADCVRTWGASCQQGGCRLEPDFEVIEHGLPWQGAGTTCVDADGDGYSDQCPPAGREDLNRDGFVDALDLSMLLGAWGTGDALADINADGTVDAADVAALLSAWGS